MGSCAWSAEGVAQGTGDLEYQRAFIHGPWTVRACCLNDHAERVLSFDHQEHMLTVCCISICQQVIEWLWHGLARP